MFSSGQKIFALVFIIVFVTIISYQFYIDRKRDKAQFKGTVWVFVTIVSVMVGYILLNKFLH